MKKGLILLILLLIPLVHASTSSTIWCEVFNGSVIGGTYNEFCYGANAIYPSNHAPLLVNDSITVIGTVNATAFYDDGVLLTNNAGGNSSWNESYADTLYSPINYGDEWNKTYADTLYTNNTDTNTNCSITNSCPLIAYDSEINKTYVDTQDSAQDVCSEITGCVENAITDGNTNWDNSYNLLDMDTDAYCSDAGCGTDDQTCAEVSGCTENAYNSEANLTALLDNNYIAIGTKVGNTTIEIFNAVNNGTYISLAQILAFSYYNISDFDIADYSTKAEADLLYAPIGYGDEWNKTYADTLYTNNTDTNETTRVNTIVTTDCDADNYLYGFDSDGTKKCRADQSGAGAYDLNITNGSVNAVITDSEKLGILAGTGITVGLSGNDYTITNTITDTDTNTNCSVDNSCAGIVYETELNKTYVDTQDSAQDACSEITGCIENAITDGNIGWDNTYNFWNDTYATFNKTYADTLYADISVTGDNTSWNQSHASTLYSPTNYGDQWNKTYADTLYTNNTDTNTNCSVANSCPLLVYSTNTTWITSNQGYNTTAQIFNAVNNGTYISLAQVLAFSYYNISNFNIADYSTTAQAALLYAPINYGDQWNKTYADTLYTNNTDTNTNCSAANTCSLIVYNTNTSWITANQGYNTTAQIFNAVDNGTFLKSYTNLTEDDVEAYIFDSDNTANLDMNNYNITVNTIVMENDQPNHWIYDNSSCIVIKAGTTYLEVCE